MTRKGLVSTSRFIALADAVEATGAGICVGGHWGPMGSDELVSGLRAEGHGISGGGL